jgi:hypothetical protein
VLSSRRIKVGKVVRIQKFGRAPIRDMLETRHEGGRPDSRTWGARVLSLCVGDHVTWSCSRGVQPPARLGMKRPFGCSNWWASGIPKNKGGLVGRPSSGVLSGVSFQLIGMPSSAAACYCHGWHHGHLTEISRSECTSETAPSAGYQGTATAEGLQAVPSTLRTSWSSPTRTQAAKGYPCLLSSPPL